MMPLLTDKRKLYLVAAVFILVAAGTVFILRSRRERETFTEQSRFLMGTYCTIKATGKGNISSSIDRAMEVMQKVDEKFNHRNKNSPVYKFNHLSEAIEDKEIISLAEKAIHISKASSGALDITVYPLVELWGFNGNSPARPPEDEIKKALQSVGIDKIEISGERMDKSSAKVKIDMGAIAKGHAVDRAAEFLKREGINSALIEAGGDIYVTGKKFARKWKVGIAHPRSNKILKIIEISNRAVATSGDYERYFMKKGLRYHHILDPRTGFPAHHIASVTVIAPKTAVADAWATALFVMKPESAVELAESVPEIECMIITPEMKIFNTAGFDSYLQ